MWGIFLLGFIKKHCSFFFFMSFNHRIKEKIRNEEFIEILSHYQDSDIYSTEHTFDRLNENERKIFKHDDLITIVRQKRIFLVGIQYNGLFTVIFDFSKNEAVRMVFEVHPFKIEIITFYLVNKNEIPRI